MDFKLGFADDISVLCLAFKFLEFSDSPLSTASVGSVHSIEFGAVDLVDGLVENSQSKEIASASLSGCRFGIECVCLGCKSRFGFRRESKS